MEINIGGRNVGDGHPCYVVAEVGINHNGDLATAKRLIAAAAMAGCDAVKFQKRTVDLVYSSEELARPRESVFGNTNGDLKRGLEFGKREYDQIAMCCREHDIHWFASCWDVPALEFMTQYDPPALKLASACITDRDLVEHTARVGVPLLASTGMSTPQEIEAMIRVIHDLPSRHYDGLILLHCVSIYPAANEALNLRSMTWLRDAFNKLVGYSGHEVGLATTLAAVAMGACVVERHVTLNRAMWGSDQAASIEPHALSRLVRDIRAIEQAMGDGIKRVLPGEVAAAAKLRRVLV